jgi:hypothetical protein
MQFRLVFKPIEQGSLRLNFLIAKISFFSTVLLTLIDIKFLFPVCVLFTCIFVNAIAVIVRVGLCRSPSILRSLSAFICFLIVVSIIYSPIFLNLFSLTGRSILSFYPLIICILVSTTLLSISDLSKNDDRNLNVTQ